MFIGTVGSRGVL